MQYSYCTQNKKPVFDKLLRILRIILKLASNKSYSDDGHLIWNNQVVPNTNITILINHAMTAGRLINGEDEFIKILHEANINPEDIINPNIQRKLSLKYSNTLSTPQENLHDDSIITETINDNDVELNYNDINDDNEDQDLQVDHDYIKPNQNKTININSNKRKRSSDIVNDNEPSSKRSNWVYPD